MDLRNVGMNVGFVFVFWSALLDLVGCLSFFDDFKNMLLIHDTYLRQNQQRVVVQLFAHHFYSK